MGMLHHNHDNEFRVVDGIRLSDILFGETNPRLVDFELDLGWASRAGMDTRKLFVDNPTRFPVLHVKDHNAARDAWTDVGQRRDRLRPRLREGTNARACGTGWWNATTSLPRWTPRGTAYEHLAALRF